MPIDEKMTELSGLTPEEQAKVLKKMAEGKGTGYIVLPLDMGGELISVDDRVVMLVQRLSFEIEKLEGRLTKKQFVDKTMKVSPVAVCEVAKGVQKLVDEVSND